jgi:pimeloyl-ACP methyl ester carboxylesterase
MRYLSTSLPPRLLLSSSKLLFSTSPFKVPTHTFIAGRRCLIVPSPSPSASSSPPLLLIGGTAQSTASWVAHTPALSKDRHLVLYEGRGQGPQSKSADYDDDFSDCSMQKQVDDLAAFVNALPPSLFPSPSARLVDVAGFSFGARLALSYASTSPSAPLRRLHLTGIAPERDAFARTAFHAWRDLLSPLSPPGSLTSGPRREEAERQLRAFAWSTVHVCHSATFVGRYEKLVPNWVELVVQGNTVEGLGGIVRQTHGDSRYDPLSLAAGLKAKRLDRGDGMLPVKIAIGDNDLLCGAGTSVEFLRGGGKKLAEALGGTVDFFNGGHNVCAEAPKEWQRHLLEFLRAP